MEIPNVNKYNSIEKISNINFLNKDIEMKFSIDEEAVGHIPEVTDKELETGQEKYHILLGDFNQIDENNVDLNIKGILEADENEKDLFYKEKTEAVTPNLSAIKKWVTKIQSALPEYKNFNFIGDIHTHPITKDNQLDKNVSASSPSNEDVVDIIQEYENGTLSPNEPFIFGIAGRKNLNKETEYAFYRLVKDNNEYKIIQLEKK
jgi:hypothetical protein